jgi:cytochrome c6
MMKVRVVAVLSVLMLASLSAFGADVIKGGEIYNLRCATCHGPNGVSTLPTAPSFARGERIMQAGDAALFTSVKFGKNGMPAWQGILKDREIFDVLAFIRTLQR